MKINFLICPACKNKLAMGSRIMCKTCKVAYPVVKGIPVLTTKETEVSSAKTMEKSYWKKFGKKDACPNYEYGLYSAFRTSEFKDFMVKFFNKTHGTMVDAGCGTGLATKIFAEHGFNTISFDISIDLLLIAKEIAKKNFFMTSDVENIPIDDGTADVVFFGGVLHHLKDKAPALKESFRILKNNGTFVAVEPNIYDIPAQVKFLRERLKGNTTLAEYPISPFKINRQIHKIFGNCELSFPKIEHCIENEMKSRKRRVYNRMMPKVMKSKFFVAKAAKRSQ